MPHGSYLFLRCLILFLKKEKNFDAVESFDKIIIKFCGVMFCMIELLQLSNIYCVKELLAHLHSGLVSFRSCYSVGFAIFRAPLLFLTISFDVTEFKSTNYE